jgi:PAS domain S-box-containing protein
VKVEDSTMPDEVKTFRVKVIDEQIELEKDAINPEKNAIEGVVIGDLWGYISDVNEVVVKMFGANDKSEFVGKNVLEFLVKEEKGRAVQNSIDSIANGQVQKQEYRVRTKSGKEITVEVTTDFIISKQGEKIGFIDIVRNLSD